MRFLTAQEAVRNFKQSIGLTRHHCSRLSKTKGACSAMHGVMGFVIIGCCIGAVVVGFVMLALDPRGAISWGAHVGGIIAGLVLVVVLRRRDVPLFDRTIVTPRAVVPAAVAGADDVNAALPRRQTPWGRPS